MNLTSHFSNPRLKPHWRYAVTLSTAFFVLMSMTSCDQSQPENSGELRTETVGSKPPALGEKIDYNRDVLPILSYYCYHCHGPDTATREPKEMPLRLDLRDQALAYENSKGTRTIVPGDPDASELVRRIESHDPELRMPQDEEKLLNKEQIALLRRWIKEGAEFRNHWAFETPEKAPLPKVSDSGWVRNGIDHFILDRLDKEKLKPNEEADRNTLIRRVTLSLTGLLPTPEEVQNFINDPAHQDVAYAKVVDRLLASPAYGEHRGRFWLDYARYGDTHGIHVDAYRHIWPYRDYVIRSLNEDKPFDRFTREQLAGDLLPDANLDSIVATGFIRAGLASGEGGTIPQELWVNNKRERTEAFGTVFMGMTVGCAVCHDHKYDPISTEDFYSLTAYFGNINEKPYHNDKPNWAPFQVLPSKDDLAPYNKLLAEKTATRKQLSAIYDQSWKDVAKWLKSDQAPKEVDRKDLVTHLPLDEGEGDQVREAVQNKTYKYEGAPPQWDEYPLFTGSFRLDNNTRFQLPKHGDFEKDQAFSVSFWMRWNEEPLGQGARTGGIISRIDGKDLRGWDLYLEKGKVTTHLIHKSPDNALTVTAKSMIPRTEWVHVCMTYDGSAKAAGVKIFYNTKEIPTDLTKDQLTGTIKTKTPLNLGRRGGPDSHASPLRSTGFQDVRIYKRNLTNEEVTRLPWADPVAGLFRKNPHFLSTAVASDDETSEAPQAWSPFEREAARELYLQSNPKVIELNARLAELDKEMSTLTAKVKVSYYAGANKPEKESLQLSKDLVAMYKGELGAGTMVCEEKRTPAFAHSLMRGEYGSRGKRVYARTPTFLPSLPAGSPANRMGLADWVVMKENPLTARVFVNRAWQEIFGKGLVESSEDLGIVGSRPSHPELLDYLAADFRDGDGEKSAWKMKRLYRKIVMTMAYRQSTEINAEAQQNDPNNILYARGPRYRMDAEVIRDTALQAAGLLNRKKTGGPSFLGYQPPGVWKDSYPSNTHIYNRHKGDMANRRSVYQFIKRTAVHPQLNIFDATDRLISCARRTRTNTPLAALNTLNDVTLLEAARVLANNTVSHSTDTHERLNYLAMRIWGRKLNTNELDPLKSRIKELQKLITSEDAAKLLKQGDSPQPDDLDPRECATWMCMGNLMLNSDEFINQ